jgi:predicted P-loop ATPase
MDLFRHKLIVEHNGTVATVREGFVNDHTVDAVRSLINNAYRIDCGKEHTRDALKEIACDHAFDPVLDYLAECQGKWDGKKRIDTWVIDYLGAEDTPLNRATALRAFEHKDLVKLAARIAWPSCRCAKTGFHYALRDGELLGRAGCIQRFSTNVEALAAVDRFAAGDDGWEWVACK